MAKGKDKRPQFPVKQQGGSYVDKLAAERAAKEAEQVLADERVQKKIEEYEQLIANADEDLKKKQDALDADYQSKLAFLESEKEKLAQALADIEARDEPCAVLVNSTWHQLII